MLKNPTQEQTEIIERGTRVTRADADDTKNLAENDQNYFK